MNVPATLDEGMANEVLAVIRSKFALDAASEIEITSIQIDRDEHKILIELMITTTERPKDLAKSYFGLTGKVREALGSDWSGFFPVITPQIHTGAHA